MDPFEERTYRPGTFKPGPDTRRHQFTEEESKRGRDRAIDNVIKEGWRKTRKGALRFIINRAYLRSAVLGALEAREDE